MIRLQNWMIFISYVGLMSSLEGSTGKRLSAPKSPSAQSTAVIPYSHPVAARRPLGYNQWPSGSVLAQNNPQLAQKLGVKNPIKVAQKPIKISQNQNQELASLASLKAQKSVTPASARSVTSLKLKDQVVASAKKNDTTSAPAESALTLHSSQTSGSAQKSMSKSPLGSIAMQFAREASPQQLVLYQGSPSLSGSRAFLPQKSRVAQKDIKLSPEQYQALALLASPKIQRPALPSPAKAALPSPKAKASAAASSSKLSQAARPAVAKAQRIEARAAKLRAKEVVDSKFQAKIKSKLEKEWDFSKINNDGELQYKTAPVEQYVIACKKNPNFKNLPDDALVAYTTAFIRETSSFANFFRGKAKAGYTPEQFSSYAYFPSLSSNPATSTVFYHGLKHFNNKKVSDLNFKDASYNLNLQRLKNKFSSVPDVMLEKYVQFCNKNKIADVNKNPEWPPEKAFDNPKFSPSKQQQMYKTLQELDGYNRAYLDKYKKVDSQVYSRLGNPRNVMDAIKQTEAVLTGGFIHNKNLKLQKNRAQDIESYYNKKYNSSKNKEVPSNDQFVAISKDIQALKLKKDDPALKDKVLKDNLETLYQDALSVKISMNAKMVAHKVELFMKQIALQEKNSIDSAVYRLRKPEAIKKRNEFLEAQSREFKIEAEKKIREVQSEVSKLEGLRIDQSRIEPNVRTALERATEVLQRLKVLKNDPQKELLYENVVKQLKIDQKVLENSEVIIPRRSKELVDKSLKESPLNLEDIQVSEANLFKAFYKNLEQDKSVQQSIQQIKRQDGIREVTLENLPRILDKLINSKLYNGNLATYVQQVQPLKAYKQGAVKLQEKIVDIKNQGQRVLEVDNVAFQGARKIINYSKKDVIGDYIPVIKDINKKLAIEIKAIKNNKENLNVRDLDSPALRKDVESYNMLLNKDIIQRGEQRGRGEKVYNDQIIGLPRVTVKELLKLYDSMSHHVQSKYNKNMLKIANHDKAVVEVNQIWKDGNRLNVLGYDPIINAFAKIKAKFDRNGELYREINRLEQNYKQQVAEHGLSLARSNAETTKVINAIDQLIRRNPDIQNLYMYKTVFEQLGQKFIKTQEHKNNAREIIDTLIAKDKNLSTHAADIKNLLEKLKDPNTNLNIVLREFKEKTGIDFKKERGQFNRNGVVDTVHYMEQEVGRKIRTYNENTYARKVGNIFAGGLGYLMGSKPPEIPIEGILAAADPGASAADIALYNSVEAWLTLYGIVFTGVSVPVIYQIVVVIKQAQAQSLAIQNNDNLTDEEKKSATTDMMSAMMTDIGTLYVADKIGVDASTVAATGIMSGSTESIGEDAQSLAIDAGFNKLIQSFTPEDSKSGSNGSPVNTGNYVSNIDKFKVKYAQLELEKAAHPSVRPSYNSPLGESAPTPYIPNNYSSSSYYTPQKTYPSFDTIMGL